MRDSNGFKKKNRKAQEASKKTHPEIKNWVVLWGQPGGREVCRVGFAGGKCYLEYQNDGFPNPGAGGGFWREIPQEVVCGKKLDARKFNKFLHSILDEEIRDFSDPIWIYEPEHGRPLGEIRVVQHLSTVEEKDDGNFSFEKTLVKREVVLVEGTYYIRVTQYRCSAENNGRPVYSYVENYHYCLIPDEAMRVKLVTAESGLNFAAKSASYRYEENGTGVIF